MPKRKAAENSTARRAVVAARVVVPSNANPSPGSASGSGSNNNGFGWGSLLSGLPQEPNDEDHEEWVERLFGNEQRGCTSPLHNSLLGNGEGNWGMPGTSQPMQQASRSHLPVISSLDEVGQPLAHSNEVYMADGDVMLNTDRS